MRKSIVVLAMLGLVLSVTVLARTRAETRGVSPRTLTRAEMKSTSGGYQTCSGIDCNASGCFTIFSGSKKYVGHPHSVCIFTVWYSTCTEFWLNQTCVETFYYTDNNCTVLNPAPPNPTSTTRNFCAL